MNERSTRHVLQLNDAEAVADAVSGTPVGNLQLDIACAVARMEQAYAERGTALGYLLMQRLAECDAPRLRRHLTPEMLARLEANQ